MERLVGIGFRGDVVKYPLISVVKDCLFLRERNKMAENGFSSLPNGTNVGFDGEAPETVLMACYGPHLPPKLSILLTRPQRQGKAIGRFPFIWSPRRRQPQYEVQIVVFVWEPLLETIVPSSTVAFLTAQMSVLMALYGPHLPLVFHFVG